MCETCDLKLQLERQTAFLQELYGKLYDLRARVDELYSRPYVGGVFQLVLGELDDLVDQVGRQYDCSG